MKPKRSAQPANISRRRASDSTNVLATIITLMVGALLVASVWVSGSAIAEKLKLSRALKQIVDIVGEVRETAANDQHLGQIQHEDLLADLARLRNFPVTGEDDGLKTVANPWEGSVTATTDAAKMIRIETKVPAHICRRIIDLFGGDAQAFGASAIEARRDNGAWQAVYTGPHGAPAGDADIAQACGIASQTAGWSAVALSFGLR